MESSITLPDTLAHWPWPRVINVHYEDCKRESAAWVESYHVFGQKAQLAFNKCDFNLLASLAYPKLSRDGCKIGCDLMNLFFIFDEFSDLSDECETRRQADAIMDALRNPHKPRPEDEWVGGRAARDFWLNAIQTASTPVQERFIGAFQPYTDAVVQQSFDRAHNHIRNIQSYFSVRRETIGAKPSFAINALHYGLPDEVLNHPAIQHLTLLCIDMLIIGNDLCSYNVEQSRGDDGHNLVKVVMVELGLGLQETLSWIGDLHNRLAGDFMKQFSDLPRFPDAPDTVKKGVLEYADDLGNWVRANDQWSFESQRYFGADGLHVMKSRTVALLPKQPHLLSHSV